MKSSSRDPKGVARDRVPRLANLRRVARALRREDVPRLLGLFALVLAAGGCGIFLLERGRNPQFEGVGDGLWWSIVTLTTIGYGDKYPVTGAGRVLAAIVMLAGLGTVGTVTAKIAAVLVARRIREGQGLGEARLRGHLVVFGWKTDMLELVAGLLAAQPGLMPDRIVLVNQAGPAANQGLRDHFPGLGYVDGDPVDPAVLDRAGVAQARRALVLADETGGRSSQETDARTVLTVMNVENLAPEVYTCAEVIERTFVEHLRVARCDEVVLSRDHARAMLLSASVATGMTQLVERLLAPAGLATVPVPDAYVGRRFSELAEHVRAESGQLLIGLVENTGHSLAIKREALRAAQKTEDVTQLLQNLRSVHELVSNRPVLNPPQNYLVKRHALAVVLAAPESYA